MALQIMQQAPLAAFLLGRLIRRLVCVSGLLVTVAFHARNAHFAILSLLTRTCGSGRLLRLAFSPTLVARLAMSSVASMATAIIVGRRTPPELPPAEPPLLPPWLFPPPWLPPEFASPLVSPLPSSLFEGAALLVVVDVEDSPSFLLVATGNKRTSEQ